MLEFYLNNNEYELPDSWEDLTPDQFLTLIDLMRKYKRGEIDYLELKVLFVMKILGIKPRRIRSEEKKQLRDENLFRLSEQVTFFLQVVYENQEKFERFSPNVKKQLKKHLPEEIDSKNPEIRLAKRMNRYYDIDAVFLKNLLPEIRIGRQTYQGYAVDITEDVATTTLSAIQFADALTVANKIVKGKQDLIPVLIGILYQRDRYSDQRARELAEIFKSLDETTKQAVLINFIAVREYIIRHTKYKILFTEDDQNKKKKKDKYSNGLVDSIDSLVKLGYGTGDELENKNLFRFLDLSIKSLRDAIRTAMQQDAKKADVAQKLGISVKLINELE
jgi:hypothetical protein